MKTKLDADDDITLNKHLKLHLLTVIVRSVFKEDINFYPHVYLDMCLYEL